MSEQVRSRVYAWLCEQTDDLLAEYVMSCISPAPLDQLVTREHLSAVLAAELSAYATSAQMQAGFRQLNDKIDALIAQQAQDRLDAAVQRERDRTEAAELRERDRADVAALIAQREQDRAEAAAQREQDRAEVAELREQVRADVAALIAQRERDRAEAAVLREQDRAEAAAQREQDRAEAAAQREADRRRYTWFGSAVAVGLTVQIMGTHLGLIPGAS